MNFTQMRCTSELALGNLNILYVRGTSVYVVLCVCSHLFFGANSFLSVLLHNALWGTKDPGN